MNDDQVEEIMKLPEAETIAPDAEVKTVVQEKHGPEDIAAAFFKMQRSKFELLLKKLAPYQIRKAIMYVVSYPFDDTIKLETDEEKQFAYLAHEMMFNKSIMQLVAEQAKVDQAQQQALQEGDEAATIEENKEVKDGE